MKDMFVVSMLLVENAALSGVVYLSYAATNPGWFRRAISKTADGSEWRHCGIFSSLLIIAQELSYALHQGSYKFTWIAGIVMSRHILRWDSSLLI